MAIYYMNRHNKELKQEKVPGYIALRWMYGSTTGRIAVHTMLRRKLFSRLVGGWQNLSWSKRKISSFVKAHGIDMKEAEISDVREYESFNHFFIRKLKKEARPIDQDQNALVSPADGKLLAYENIDVKKVVQVKGITYSLAELLDNQELAEEYREGSKIIIRLAPADYHRFHYPDSGEILSHRQIHGKYDSVSPVALEKVVRLYCQNKREIMEISTLNFGKILYLEIGATCVGSIFQNHKVGDRIGKGEEKGYFSFGGSTVILFIKKGEVNIDGDLLEHSAKGMETKVLMGEVIGKKKGSL